MAGTKYLKNNDHNLLGFSLATVQKATDRFTDENKLGEGGYGPVYKVYILNLTNPSHCVISKHTILLYRVIR